MDEKPGKVGDRRTGRPQILIAPAGESAYGAREPRRPGRLKGRIRIGPDFDEPLPEEILAAFRGEGE